MSHRLNHYFVSFNKCKDNNTKKDRIYSNNLRGYKFKIRKK